jgi:hypothetical protein
MTQNAGRQRQSSGRNEQYRSMRHHSPDALRRSRASVTQAGGLSAFVDKPMEVIAKFLHSTDFIAVDGTECAWPNVRHVRRGISSSIALLVRGKRHLNPAEGLTPCLVRQCRRLMP